MTYLRQARIVHRDIKAENVLLTDKSVVKLIDFGTAKDLENPHIKGAGNANSRRTFHDYVGTPQFMPPEVIENKFTDFRSDTWSLGCFFFQVVAGIPPFHGLSEYASFQRVMALDLQFPPGMPERPRDMISRILVKEADERLGALDIEELKAHPFWEGGQCFKAAHLRPRPVLSLAEYCLRRIGKSWKELGTKLHSWPRVEELSPTWRTR